MSWSRRWRHKLGQKAEVWVGVAIACRWPAPDSAYAIEACHRSRAEGEARRVDSLKIVVDDRLDHDETNTTLLSYSPIGLVDRNTRLETWSSLSLFSGFDLL